MTDSPSALDIQEAKRIDDSCVCGVCHAALYQTFAPSRKYYVWCAESKAHRGYISRKKVERQAAESRHELNEVTAFYTELKPIHKDENADDSISSLGYEEQICLL